MGIFNTVSLIIALLAYLIAVFAFIRYREKMNEISFIVNEREHSMKTFYFEDKMLKKFEVTPEKVRFAIYLERILLFSAFLIMFIMLRGLAIGLVGALAVSFIADDSYKKVIYKSGMENINRITNFINYFVPHINSGNSADQSLLGYISYANDVELSEWYENKEKGNYTIPVHLRQIIDIYDIAKYNEQQGIMDYTYILNELSQDMAQKQVYYNSFVSRIGEIKPIMWSYYIGVPVLILISFNETSDFWMGIGGYIVSIILLLLFTAFKFLIYKLQKNTINLIF